MFVQCGFVSRFFVIDISARVFIVPVFIIAEPLFKFLFKKYADNSMIAEIAERLAADFRIQWNALQYVKATYFKHVPKMACHPQKGSIHLRTYFLVRHYD